LKRAQTAGRRFIKEGLDDTDRVALFSSSGDFLDYTADQSKLADAIDKLKSHPKFSEIGLGGCPRISPFEAYQISVMLDRAAIDAAIQEAGTCNSSGDDSSYIRVRPRVKTPSELEIQSQAELLWGQVRIASQATLDAIGHALNSLQAMPGRRLFLLISSGFNSSTLEPERDQLINQALRAGVVISSVDAKGLYTEVPGRDASDGISVTGTLPFQAFRYETSAIGTKLFTNNQVMSDLAQATGGLFFHNNNDLPHGFRQLGSLPEVSYVLGFHRPDAAADGKYHKLKVTLRESNSYVVQARPGYFATPSAPAAPPDPLDREVSGISTRTDFPVSVAFQLDRGTVKTQIHVALDKLQFPIRDQRHVQHLTIVVALLDEKGNVVVAKQGAMDFAMTDATYLRYSTSGINAGLNLDAPPGKYRLRAVVQEAVEGKVATSSLNIEVK
jgi:VWFA-related protein